MGKLHILISNGFSSHKTLEVLESCFENNVALCRLPSHTTVVRLDGCSIKMLYFDDHDDGLCCSCLRSNLRYILCVVTPEPLV
jgi:hypothetical protein